MTLTIGQLMFYGGIAGAVLFTVLAIVVWTLYERRKRKLLKAIENEF